MPRTLCRPIGLLLFLALLPSVAIAQLKQPFGPEFPNLDSDATGQWWKPKGKKEPRLLVPRDEVIGFAVYTHQNGTLKLTAQLYPLKPDESREVVLEFKRDGQWQQAAKQDVIELGWSAHFRIKDWDNTKTVPYRLSHAGGSTFEGTIRKDPVDKETIVVASMSCNSSRTPGPRPTMVNNLLEQDPDLLFCAGDQSYHHTQHTYGWLEFGRQFRDVLKDRPVITIPDDHDVGQANIWGENGKVASTAAGPDGGYFYPVDYVNMVQRCQTWHLPDPFDPAPIEREISVYYTNLTVGGVDFAILEDRKFKSGPEGKIPKMGPRPDHINDPDYDRKSVDVPGLKLLGDRQLEFLKQWSQDWTGAQMKCALSQTAFCGAVHLHGQPENRLLADLDCNGWPQTGRNKALAAIRQAWAPHLCGDQHLAVTVKHGIDNAGDGPYAFTSPALVNTIYGRWWHPEDEQPGPNAVPGSPLPWTGDFLDGLGNHIRMLAYANPEDPDRRNQTGRRLRHRPIQQTDSRDHLRVLAPLRRHKPGRQSPVPRLADHFQDGRQRWPRSRRPPPRDSRDRRRLARRSGHPRGDRRSPLHRPLQDQPFAVARLLIREAHGSNRQKPPRWQDTHRPDDGTDEGAGSELGEVDPTFARGCDRSSAPFG